MIRRLIAALVLLASGCFLPAPLVAQRTDSVQAFAFAPSATVDSLVTRSRRDTTLLTVRNGSGIVIWRAPAARFRALRDSARVWCQAPGCMWEWDELIPADTAHAEPELDAPASLPWGLDAIGAPLAWAMGARGQGVILTALDSGIDPTHPEYAVAGGFNAVGGSVFGGGGSTGWADDIPSCRGHGTHTAGTIAGKTHGVAPDARLFGVKVFQDINGQCLSYTSAQIAGINWAVANGSRGINISISGTGSAAFQQAVAAANAAGALVSRANGNSGTTPPQGVAAELQTASVGPSLAPSGFSNWGPTPQTDFAAPGENVQSSLPGGGYGAKSGTSMAAPHVIGAAALVMSKFPGLSWDSVLIALQRSAIPLGSPVPNDRTGYGLVRPDRAIAWLQGGVAIAASTTDTIPPTAPLVPVCKPVVALGPWSATSSAPWLRVTTTPDTLCYSIDSALLPSGGATVTGTITTRSTP